MPLEEHCDKVGYPLEHFFNIIDEVYFLKSDVVCFVKRIWKDLGIDKIIMVAKGVFLVRFLEHEAREKAFDMIGFIFDNKTFYCEIMGSLYVI